MIEAKPKLALIAITKHGCELAKRVATVVPDVTVITPAKFADKFSSLSNPLHSYEGALSQEIAVLFREYDQLVFCVSLGAVIRLIAPHLKSKDEDPGVLVIDDKAEFVIPVLSGHIGGANAYAESLAQALGATAVVTTASDVGKTIAVDILGRELGWKVEAPKINITRVSAHVVNEEAIAFVQEAGSKNWWTRKTPLPANIHLFDRFEDVNLDTHKAVLWVTQREIDAEHWRRLEERLVVYRPPQP